ncbi:hypothetical protein SAMN05444515_1331, partial [Ectothiorhodospira marina]
GVLIVERWILAALRHRQHFSLGQLKSSIRELPAAVKVDGTRVMQPLMKHEDHFEFQG